MAIANFSSLFGSKNGLLGVRGGRSETIPGGQVTWADPGSAFRRQEVQSQGHPSGGEVLSVSEPRMPYLGQH